MSAASRRLRILVWHVHGSWTTSFVHGGHTYLLPKLPEQGAWGLGRADRPWPEDAIEVSADRLQYADVDLVVLQRPEEVDLVCQWTGRRPGRDLPAVYVEHNTPKEHAATSRHPLADNTKIVIVHVTHFNQLMWDNGIAPTVVIPHGIVDPGYHYSGELARTAVLINEPVRRWRIVGTDLLPAFAQAAPIDVYGMGSAELGAHLPTTRHDVHPVGDVRQDELHRNMARRRVYLHTARWTSLGLSLIEAMHLGMPVVAPACTEAVMAIPGDAGFVSTDTTNLLTGMRRLIDDPDLAVTMGRSARKYALAHYGLDPFLRRWDSLFERVLDSTTVNGKRVTPGVA